MKKILASIATISLAVLSLQAQDMAQITEIYNNGANALSAGEKTSALEAFEQALAAATAIGDQGKDVVANCKNVIPSLIISIAKEDAKTANFDAAIEKLNSAIARAEAYNDTEAANEAKTLIPQFALAKGNNLLNAKDFAGAAEAYKKAIELQPANGQAMIRLGMALAGAGDIDGAIDAYKQAAENNQASQANKQLSKLYLKLAASELKNKSYEKAYEQALESANYQPSGNAYKIAGTAANALGKKAEAIENLSKYLELTPNAKDAEQIKAAIEALKK